MEKIGKFIVSVIGGISYPGIIFLMFLESSFFPFPSEVVIPPAGYLAQKGLMKIEIIILSGVLGSLLGALFNYFIAVKFGRLFILKYGKYFGISKKRYEKAEYFFKKHGEISTFVGRLLPLIRQYISFPAGLAKMNLVNFSIFTSLGASIWVSILTYIGYIAGKNEELIKLYLHKSLIYIIIFSIITTLIYIKLKK